MITARSRSLGTCALGRAIDASGEPLDGGPALRGRLVALNLQSPRPNERSPIATPLWSGVRAIDGLLTIGRGARVGIFGAPGTGKSKLIESIVEGAAADAVIVALVGERGREAQQWVAFCGPRTTIVCATSDRPSRERIDAAHLAIVQAAALRQCGLHVLLVVDSLARVAAALRETGVAAGESAGRGGYPPSVFAELARMVEPAGVLRSGGSITLIATVLSDGDDRDPVSDAARSLLDGHIQLSKDLADAGRFPAIDVPASTSRTMEAVAAEPHVQAARAVRRALALLERIDDARALGIEPSDPYALAVIASERQLEDFLRQGTDRCGNEAMLKQLTALAERLEGCNGDR
jgi:ATP synthase in type III secretion protein N